MILRDFRIKIADIINNSQLPIDAVYYTLKDVMIEIENLYNEECYKEDLQQAEERENAEVEIEESEDETQNVNTETSAGQE